MTVNTLGMFRIAEQLSVPQLVQSLQNGTIDHTIGQLVLNNKMQQQKKMQQAQATQQPPRPPISQENMAKGQLMSGVARVPAEIYQDKGMFGGGIVGYNEGGPVKDEGFPLDADTLRRLQEFGITYPFSDADRKKIRLLHERQLLDRLPKKTEQPDASVDEAIKEALANSGNLRPVIDARNRPAMGFDLAQTPPGVALQNLLFDNPPKKPKGGSGSLDLSGVKDAAGAVGKSLVGVPLLTLLRDKVLLPLGLSGGDREQKPQKPTPEEIIAALQRSEPPASSPGGASIPGVSVPGMNLRGYDDIMAGMGNRADRMSALSKQREAELGVGDKEAFQGIKDIITKQKGTISDVDKKNLYLSLMKAGFATAAGDSQYALQNIARGSEAGVDSYIQRDVLNRANQNQLAQAEQMMRLQELNTAKGNRMMADKYAQGIAGLDLGDAQLKMGAVDAANRNEIQKAGLGLQAAQINQQGALQRAQIDGRSQYYKAMQDREKARQMGFMQKAAAEFMAGPGQELARKMEKKHGANWDQIPALQREFDNSLKTYVARRAEAMDMLMGGGGGTGGMGGMGGIPNDDDL